MLSAGVGEPATMTAQDVLRGDDAFVTRTRLAALAPDDAERALRGYWRAQHDWVEADKVTWRWDDQRGALVLTLAGSGKPDWDGDAEDGRRFSLPGAGFTPPATMRRPKEQDQSAAWLTDFPRYRCWATTMRLPPATGKRRWDYRARPVERQLGGIAYWRRAALRDGVMRVVMSRRVLAARDQPRPRRQRSTPRSTASTTTFRRCSRPSDAPARDLAKAAAPAPFADDTDWVNAPDACLPPSVRDSALR